MRLRRHLEHILSNDFFLSPRRKAERRRQEQLAEHTTHQVLDTIVSRLDADPQTFFISLAPNAIKNLRAHRSIIEDQHQLPYLTLTDQQHHHHDQAILELYRRYTVRREEEVSADRHAAIFAERYQATLPTEAHGTFATDGPTATPIHTTFSAQHNIDTSESFCKLLFIPTDERIVNQHQIQQALSPYSLDQFELRFNPYSSIIEYAADGGDPEVYVYLGPLEGPGAQAGAAPPPQYQLFLSYTEHYHRPKPAPEIESPAVGVVGLQPSALQGNTR